MIKIDSPCFRNLKVGDAVIVKLLPYSHRRKTIRESLVFPIIGFSDSIPLIGTTQDDLYDNHRFITTARFFTHPDLIKWKYCMRLNASDIEIERILKAPRSKC